MPSDKYDPIGRIKAVEREHTPLRFTTDHVLNSLGEGGIALHEQLKRLDIDRASERLERTYIIRLFSEFEVALKIILREDLFRIEYADKEAYSQEKFRLDLKPNGLTVHDFLTVALADLNAVYRVRKNYIEITTPAAAVAECFADDRKDETPAARLRREPLVSHAATEQTVYDAARQIAFRYGKVVAFDPAVGTRRNKTVSPHWTNLPFPTAIRLLALEAGLDVKEMGGVLTITNPGKKKGK